MYNILNIECGGTKYFNYYLKVFKEGVWDILSRKPLWGLSWEFLWCKNHQVYYQVFIFPQEKPSLSYTLKLLILNKSYFMSNVLEE